MASSSVLCVVRIHLNDCVQLGAPPSKDNEHYPRVTSKEGDQNGGGCSGSDKETGAVKTGAEKM